MKQVFRRRQVPVVQRSWRGVKTVLEVRMAHVRETVVCGRRWIRRCVHVVRRRAPVGCYVIDPGHWTDDGSRHGNIRRRGDLSTGGTVRQFAFGPTGGQEVAELRFVSSVDSGGRGRYGVRRSGRGIGEELIRFREVAVWKTCV